MNSPIRSRKSYTVWSLTDVRIKTILKRVDNKLDDKKSQKDKVFELKESDMQILFKGESLVLTLAEYDILKLLIQRNHGVVSREDFIYTSDNIEDESSLKNIDVIISRIRTKLALTQPKTKPTDS